MTRIDEIRGNLELGDVNLDDSEYLLAEVERLTARLSAADKVIRAAE